MKKLLFTLLACLFAVSSAFAGNLKVKSGNITVNQENATAVVSVNLDGCRWEKKEDFKEWCGSDYETRVNAAAPSLVSGFNAKSKGLKLSTTAADAKYKVVFTVRNMQRNQGMGVWGSCYIKLYGTIVITEIATGNEVCVIEVDGQKGDTDFVENDRMAKAFVGVGEELAKKK